MGGPAEVRQATSYPCEDDFDERNQSLTTEHFDLIAIGGGSGGLAVAQRAALHGRRAMVVEAARLGGTCVNVGCVPKKVMWHAADILELAHDAAGYGIALSAPEVDWSALRRRRDAYIERLNGIYARNLEQRGVVSIQGRARLQAGRRVVVGERTFTADHVVVATGGRPVRPRIPGADLGLTSDDFFAMDTLPARVAVVGSGYIAVELASLLRAFGVEVRLYVRRDGVLREFDAMVGSALTREFEADGIGIVTHFVPAALERSGSDLVLHAEDGHKSEPVDAVFWAIGREPLTEGIGLAEAGVRTDAHGFVVTDAFQDTNVPGVHAIGDVTGRIALTPVAIAAGRRLGDRLFGGQPDRKLDYENVPTVVFTHPPVGTVGLTEAQARARHEQVDIRTTSFTALYSALAVKRRTTEMKLVLAGPRQQVVGVHIVGDGADEMLQGFAVAVRMGATLQDLNDTVAIHPTSAEELVTMK